MSKIRLRQLASRARRSWRSFTEHLAVRNLVDL